MSSLKPVTVKEDRAAPFRSERMASFAIICRLSLSKRLVSQLPIGPETGAMLWHAKQLGCLGAMLPLAAVIEVGGLRRNPARSHGLDTSSDYLDAALAFRLMYFARKRGVKRATPEGRNISLRRSLAAADLMHDLEQRLACAVNFEFDDLEHGLSQSVLAGSIDKLFRSSGLTKQFVSLKNREQKFAIGQGSVVAGRSDLSYVVGNLRVITPSDEAKRPFTILEKVTMFNLDDLKELARTRPELNFA